MEVFGCKAIQGREYGFLLWLVEENETLDSMNGSEKREHRSVFIRRPILGYGK